MQDDRQKRLLEWDRSYDRPIIYCESQKCCVKVPRHTKILFDGSIKNIFFKYDFYKTETNIGFELFHIFFLYFFSEMRKIVLTANKVGYIRA